MNFCEYLKTYNAQKKIDKLAHKYKNRQIVMYGAGQFFSEIVQNYDLSKLNIVAVCDKKFEIENKQEHFGYNCITPKELGDYNCDLILISNFDYDRFVTILDDHILYRKKNEGIEIRPLIKLTFFDLFLKGNKT